MGAGSPGDGGGFLAAGEGIGPGARVAGYVVEDLVGRGGMAIVCRARDVRLGRVVALKVLAPVLAGDEGFRARFIRESRAAAAVDDPHVIPVFEAGEANGVLFIAMRYVAGGDVRSLVRRLGPLPVLRAASVLSPVASALDAAHAAGLVHRDVKPANMLIDARPGRPDHVYLSDFGLSKGALSSVGLTGSGLFLGTPDYIAPEQIAGRAVDGRADQYALACAAFEMLAGQPPFSRDHAMAVIYAHASEPPPALTSLRPGLPAAADAVITRALAKDPADRYRNCREFADSLRQALGLGPYHITAAASPGEPPATAAAPPAPEPAPAAGTASRHTLIRAPAPGDATLTAITRHARTPAKTARPPGPASDADHAHQPPTAGSAAIASDSRRSTRPTRRRRTVLAVLGGVGILAAASVAAVLVTNFTGRTTNSAGHPASHHGPVASQSAQPTSPPQLVATLSHPVPAATSLNGPDYGVNSLAFSPDGHTLAAGFHNGSTYLWDMTTRRQTKTLTDPGGTPCSVAFSPDGRILAVGDYNSSIYLWDLATGQLTATLTDPGAFFVCSVAFSPDGKTLATSNGNTYLWSVATGSKIATLSDRNGCTAVAFSPDDSTLATGDDSGTTYLWDATTGHRIATLTDQLSSNPVNVTALAFSPDGKTLAVAFTGGTTELWDVAARTRTAVLAGPTVNVEAIAFSPDGTTLATGNFDASIYLWDVATGRQIATVSDPNARIYGVDGVAFSPDGKTLVTGGLGTGSIYLWRVG